MKKIFALSLATFLMSNLAKAATFSVGPVSSQTFSEEFLDKSPNYQMNISWNFKPLKVTGNLFKASTFVIKCDSRILVSESRKLNPGDFNKDISVGTRFTFDATICPSFTFVAETNISGASTEYVNVSYQVFSSGEPVESFVKRIAEERAVNKVAITKYVSKLATYAGSKEALYCLIAGNLDDILTGGVAQSVKTQYENIYGTYTPGQFTCPVDAEGKLTSSIDFCTENPGEIEPFCLVYEKYKTLSAWYDATIAEVKSRQSDILATQSEIYSKIEALRKDLVADQENFTVIVQ
jgi:hypothetical protein